MRNLLMASAACLALVGCQQGSEIISPGLTEVVVSPPPPPPPPPPPSEASTCPDGTDGTALGTKTLCDAPLGNLTTLSGVLTESATLEYIEDVVYELKGRLDVGTDAGAAGTGSPVVLTIEPGVVIVGDSGSDHIVVNRGHQIEAAGTAALPIIMTSENDISLTSEGRDDVIGEWGGLVVLGNAPINRCNVAGVNPGTADCQNAVEGVTEPDALYGGADPEANSGTLQYLQVRYAGFEVATDVELNGITLAGVGSGTTVDHIQVHNNSDDGVEFFGGTVNAKYIVVTGNDDEQLDTDNGYNGNIQFVLGTQRGGDSSDNGIEASSVAPGVTPLSNATISNFTLIGNGNTDSHGIRLNTGTVGQYLNGILIEANNCLDYEDSAGDGLPGYNAANDPTFKSVLFDCGAGLLTTGGDADTATGQAAVDADANNVVTTNSLGGFFPGPNELAVETADLSDDFFTAVDYIGAFGPDESETDNWATGWTQDVFPDPECPEGTTAAGQLNGQNLCNVTGTVTDTLRLTRGNLYALVGRVNVGVDVGSDGTAPDGDDGTLIVESGVTIFGRSGADYLVVNRGSQIFANGTATNPVIFTSENDVIDADGDRENAIGEWGGLVILGDGQINRCNVVGATSGTNDCENAVEGVTEPDALYGGSDLSDNSGSLTYVQVKYAGFEVATDVELNGITLAGVGNGTTINHVQVYNNSDDGIEFFGGNVNVKHVVVNGNDDEQLDTDNGYNGSVQYVIAVQRGGDSSDNGIEASSVAAGANNPASNATIANFTLVNNSTINNTDSHGIRMNTGTIGTYINGVIVEQNSCLDYEDSAGDGVAGFTAGADPAFQSVLFDCGAGLLTTGGDADPVTGQAAVDADTNNVVGGNSLVDTFVNGANENAVTAATIAPGGFLDVVDYIGAVKDADDTWWQGWTCGLEASTPC
ncbi:hypothetical protein [Litorimonas taeanensis]|nr:hypothetical protein [Litorimonas taeanensis]